jgi:hypothetical protein
LRASTVCSAFDTSYSNSVVSTVTLADSSTSARTCSILLPISSNLPSAFRNWWRSLFHFFWAAFRSFSSEACLAFASSSSFLTWSASSLS